MALLLASTLASLPCVLHTREKQITYRYFTCSCTPVQDDTTDNVNRRGGGGGGGGEVSYRMTYKRGVCVCVPCVYAQHMLTVSSLV